MARITPKHTAAEIKATVKALESVEGRLSDGFGYYIGGLTERDYQIRIKNIARIILSRIKKAKNG